MARTDMESPELDPQAVALADGMWTAMADYQAGRLSLERLCWEVLHRLVPVACVPWASGITSCWTQLEAINDRVLTDRRHQLTPEEHDRVADLLEDLRVQLVEG